MSGKDYKKLFESHTAAVAEFLNELGPYLGLEDGKIKPEDWIKAAADIRQWCSDSNDERHRLTVVLDKWQAEAKRLTLEELKLSNANIDCKLRIEQLEGDLKTIRELPIDQISHTLEGYAGAVRSIAKGALSAGDTVRCADCGEQVVDLQVHCEREDNICLIHDS